MPISPQETRRIAANVMETVLDTHERNLLTMAARSMAQAVALYGKRYGAREGVEAEVARLKAKVQEAIVRRVEHADTGESVPAPRPLPRAQEWEPSCTKALNGNGATAGAAPVSRSRDALPPPVAAPAAAADEEFAIVPEIPAVLPAVLPATPPVGLGPQTVRGLLAGQRMSARRLGLELGMQHGAVKALLSRMKDRGEVERSHDNAYDWPGSVHGRGRPSRVWRLTEEPEGVQMAPRRARPTSPATRSTRVSPAPVELPVAETHEHELPETFAFDAGKLWESLTIEQRDQLVVVCVQRLSYDDLLRVFVAQAERETG